MIRLGVVLAFALTEFVGCAADELPPGYNDALREVRLNARVPGSYRYEQALERKLSKRMVRANRECRRLRWPDGRGSILLYRIDSDGKPSASFVHPLTKYASCMHERIKGFELAPPPKPDYWVGVALPSAEASAAHLFAPNR